MYSYTYQYKDLNTEVCHNLLDMKMVNEPPGENGHCHMCDSGNDEAQNMASTSNIGDDSRFLSLYRQSSYSTVDIDDQDRFVHINEWFEHYGGNPCSKTETIYLDNYRSEEPVQSNMDISTGHIVLVSTLIFPYQLY